MARQTAMDYTAWASLLDSLDVDRGDATNNDNNAKDEHPEWCSRYWGGEILTPVL